MAEIHKLKQTITDGENTLKVTKREAQEKEQKLNEEISKLKLEIKSLQDQI